VRNHPVTFHLVTQTKHTLKESLINVDISLAYYCPSMHLLVKGDYTCKFTHSNYNEPPTWLNKITFTTTSYPFARENAQEAITVSSSLVGAVRGLLRFYAFGSWMWGGSRAPQVGGLRSPGFMILVWWGDAQVVVPASSSSQW
jgi:hypothetical protein